MPSLGTCPACQRGLDLEGRCLCDSRRRDGVTFRLDVVGGDVVRLDRHGDVWPEGAPRVVPVPCPGPIGPCSFGGDVVERPGDRPLYKREDNEDDGDLDGDPPWIA